MSRSKGAAGVVGAEGDTLEQRAERLRQVVATPTERDVAARELAVVEIQIAQRRAAELQARVERRRLGIKRHATALAKDQLRQDALKIDAKVADLLAAIRTYNDRVKQYEDLYHEDSCLADRFDLAPTALDHAASHEAQDVVAAALDRFRAGSYVMDVGKRKPILEEDEHNMRQRRTYAEIAGTEGHAIIMEAGLKEFPPLTAQQRELLNTQAERASVSLIGRLGATNVG